MLCDHRHSFCIILSSRTRKKKTRKNTPRTRDADMSRVPRLALSGYYCVIAESAIHLLTYFVYICTIEKTFSKVKNKNFPEKKRTEGAGDICVSSPMRQAPPSSPSCRCRCGESCNGCWTKVGEVTRGDCGSRTWTWTWG